MENTSPDRISASIAAHVPAAVSDRHHLHQNPELSHQEENTSAYVTRRLRDIGIDAVTTNVGGYGIVGRIVGAAGSGRTLALRADMDALPIQETRDVEYRSCKAGVMHACGHDGHISTLLGTAAVLAGARDMFCGEVRLLFQPAEETVGGAWRMCEEGAIDGVDAIVALHGWPGMQVGKIGVRPGPMMASSDTFSLTVRGRGAHAAQPHISIDPIMIGSQIVTALQTISSREMSPTEAVVVTVAQFHAGTASNIIPDTAELKGTIRCLTEKHRDEIPQRIERIARGICAGFRAECEIAFSRGTPVTFNNAGITELVASVGEEVLGTGNVVTLESPSMGAEDFAMYLQRVPGTMFRLGVGEEMTPLHTPTYNFADESLPVGMELFVRTALKFLSPDAATASLSAPTAT